MPVPASLEGDRLYMSGSHEIAIGKKETQVLLVCFQQSYLADLGTRYLHTFKLTGRASVWSCGWDVESTCRQRFFFFLRVGWISHFIELRLRLPTARCGPVCRVWGPSGPCWERYLDKTSHEF